MPCVVVRPSSTDEFRVNESVLLTGYLEVLSYKGHPRVQIVVHRTTTEHFAIFYPISLTACNMKPLATINLKTCIVKKIDQDVFSIRPRKDIDGVSITLKVPKSSPVDCDAMIAALDDSSPNFASIPIYPAMSCKPIRIISSSLPTLLEED